MHLKIQKIYRMHQIIHHIQNIQIDSKRYAKICISLDVFTRMQICVNILDPRIN